MKHSPWLWPFRLVEDVREMALALPEVAEGEVEGQVAFLLRGKVLAWFRPDGQALEVKMEPDLVHLFRHISRASFGTPSEYRPLDRTLVNLTRVTRVELWLALVAAWRYAAPKGCLKQYAQVVNDLETAALQ